MNAKLLAIAIAAGIASVFALFAAFRGGGLAFPLLSIAPLPVYIATLAWGTQVGVVASVSAIVVAAAAISPQAAVWAGLMVTIPASIVGHQANLAQEDGNGGIEWYPLSQLLFNLTLILTVAIIALGIFVDYPSYSSSPELGQAIQQYLKEYPQPRPITEDEIAQITSMVFSMLPFMIAGLWLIVHIVNAHVAGLICRASNILARPRDDIPATANMPSKSIAIPLFAVLGASMINGNLALAFSVIAGCFLMAFAMVGLARSHFNARNNPASLVFLILSYIFIMLAFPVLYVFAFGGVARSLSTLNNSQNTPGNSGSNNT